jgi:exopolyphosphatase/guanosine-5'-triphosphate,3'-diphosphate pyrophosphatase
MFDAGAPRGRRGPDRSGAPEGGGRRASERLFAALDLGTNNCRLLIAARGRGGGFRVVDSYSRIVRLGEGLTQTGQLQPAAMDRAMAALKVCAERIHRRGNVQVRAIATQACRSAGNGPAFLEQVLQETGLRLEIIPPKEEARLSVAGCADLIDRTAKAVLVLDVGGGSTELSWVELSADAAEQAANRLKPPPIRAWLSIPLGVVSLAERFPESGAGDAACYRAMVEAVKVPIAAFEGAAAMHGLFEEGGAHLVGTSGAITSLAGLHLGLPRYDRSKVDGVWLTRGDCEAMAERLLALDVKARAIQPCIGPDRADLVLAGAAILQAVQELWPCERVRVADRGLREGVLLSMMFGHGGRSRRRRRSGQHRRAAA